MNRIYISLKSNYVDDCSFWGGNGLWAKGMDCFFVSNYWKSRFQGFIKNRWNVLDKVEFTINTFSKFEEIGTPPALEISGMSSVCFFSSFTTPDVQTIVVSALHESLQQPEAETFSIPFANSAVDIPLRLAPECPSHWAPRTWIEGHWWSAPHEAQTLFIGQKPPATSPRASWNVPKTLAARRYLHFIPSGD